MFIIDVQHCRLASNISIGWVTINSPNFHQIYFYLPWEKKDFKEFSQSLCVGMSINDFVKTFSIYLECISTFSWNQSEIFLFNQHAKEQKKKLSTENDHHNRKWRLSNTLCQTAFVFWGWLMKKQWDREEEGENRIWQERKEKLKASLWVAMNSPAKEFPLLKALYISLCKPYHALRTS